MPSYEFRKRLLGVHKKDRRDHLLAPAADELEITEDFSVVILKSAGRVIKNAAKDFCDYLLTSMNVGVRILQVEKIDLDTTNAVILFTHEDIETSLNEASCSMGYLAKVNDNILICGFDERGAAQGIYYLEDLMNLRKAPFLKKESVHKKPLFSPRMTHSGYGLDDFPNEHLSQIAHAGMDAILVFVKDTDKAANKFIDFNELIYRAEGYGIDVYAYSYIKSSLHPDETGAYEFYDSLYGSLFKECPKLKGVVLVGESVGFRSKDPKTNGLLVEEKRAMIIPPDKPCPGWWPCEDFPKWLELLKKIIKKENDKADIVFWTYNWGYAPKEDRIKLIQNLPEDISLLVTYEMFENIPCKESTRNCTDYTLAFEGPGQYFVSEAEAAQKRGIKLYTMSNTGGLTWDIGVIPYEPCPMQWKKRYNSLKDSKKKYGLCGLMESHHYGFWPSFVSELAKWEYFSPSPDYKEIMGRIAARDFGEENADAVLTAWEMFSEGIRCCSTSVEDQYGPSRIGPSYPLALLQPLKIKTVPYAIHGGNIICNTAYTCCDSGRCTPFSIRIHDEIKLLQEGIELFSKGSEILEEFAKSDEAKYMVNLVKYIANCFKTVLHVKKWYLLKGTLLAAPSIDIIHQTANKMRELANLEIENAKSTLPLVDFDSRLGWEPSMEHIGDREHIEIKIKQVEIMLKSELAMYENMK